MYDYPTNVSNITSFLQYTNTVTDNMYGSAVIIAIGIISLTVMLFRGYPPKNSFAVSGFITTIMAILFRVMNLIPESVVYGSIIITIIFVGLLVYEP